MKRLAMHNGTVIDATIELDCTTCGAFTDFTDATQAGVECVQCGTRHSRDSLVDTSVAGVGDES